MAPTISMFHPINLQQRHRARGFKLVGDEEEEDREKVDVAATAESARTLTSTSTLRYLVVFTPLSFDEVL